jgi:hypothetical protein
MSFELTSQVYVGLRRDDLSEQETCPTALAAAAELADAGGEQPILTVRRASENGETRTRTGDTTIFRRGSESL